LAETSPIERLRKVATPDREIEEFFADLSPQTRIDSEIRDLFCRIIEQHGPFTVDMERPNTYKINIEKVVYNPAPGVGRLMGIISCEP
jgi:hypothetical protein